MSLRLPDSMPWRIYQTDLLGQGTLIKLFEEAFNSHALCGPPEPEQQQRAIKALSGKIERLKAQVGSLRAEISELRGHNFRPWVLLTSAP